jgi:serine/threonine-protein kinase
MPLPSGTKLGSYTIVSLLGAGGMGEVYQATDMRLGRQVALKIVPQEFLSDPARVARFQREAQVLASLNHPNIATIHGLEESGPMLALVMELVPGRTLAARIATGPIPLEEALPIARQIAEGLSFAHEHGVVHRDLKPANIKVLPDGKVKILDFGLAKAVADSPAVADASASPTLSIAATKAGVILGTAAYMSPEQAKGKPADKGADIWAFGCVLFEMLAGKQAFSGETVTDILAVVLRGEPEWDALPAQAPNAIRRLLRRALQKDQRLRWHDISDARLEIDEAVAQPLEQASAVAPAAALQPPAKWKSALPWAVAVALALVLVFIGTRPRVSIPSMLVTRFALDEIVNVTYGRGMSVSPDGQTLAYVVEQAGLSQLFVRRLDEAQSRPVRGASLVRAHFFSPDGQWLAFSTAEGKLKKYSLSDGSILPVCDCLTNDAVWSEDGRIFISFYGMGLWEVPSSGGTAKMLTKPDPAQGEAVHTWPAILPGGKTLLYTRWKAKGLEDASIVALNLATGEHKTILQNATSPVYSQTGHLLFSRDGAMLAVPLDVARVEITGPPVRVMDQVQVSFDGVMKLALSSSGTLIYTSERWSHLVWVDAQGQVERISKEASQFTNPRLSPDGKRLLVVDSGALWVLDLQRGAYTRLTPGKRSEPFPIWSHDAERVIYTLGTNIMWKSADGSGPEETLVSTPEGLKIASSISRDGTQFAFLLVNSTAGIDIYSFDMRSKKEPVPFIASPAYEGGAMISPNGKLIAYVSDEAGRREIFITPYPGKERKWQVSSDGGTHPHWSHDGRQLFYRNGDSMMVVKITESPSFSYSRPEVLFTGRFTYGQNVTLPNYDVSPDDRRFVMIQEQDAARSRPQVVVNWFAELRRKLESKR